MKSFAGVRLIPTTLQYFFFGSSGVWTQGFTLPLELCLQPLHYSIWVSCCVLLTLGSSVSQLASEYHQTQEDQGQRKTHAHKGEKKLFCHCPSFASLGPHKRTQVPPRTITCLGLFPSLLSPLPWASASTLHISAWPSLPKGSHV
jgi:hypothetical protein